MSRLGQESPSRGQEDTRQTVGHFKYAEKTSAPSRLSPKLTTDHDRQRSPEDTCPRPCERPGTWSVAATHACAAGDARDGPGQREKRRPRRPTITDTGKPAVSASATGTGACEGGAGGCQDAADRSDRSHGRNEETTPAQMRRGRGEHGAASRESAQARRRRLARPATPRRAIAPGEGTTETVIVVEPTMAPVAEPLRTAMVNW